MKTKAAVNILCAAGFACLQPQLARSQSPLFTQVAEAAGLWDQSIYDRTSVDGAHQAVWVDYDGDSDLDLFYSEGLFNFLYQNQGSGAFRNAIAGTGLDPDSILISFGGSTWSDFNNDGFIDLVMKNPAGDYPPVLYLNSGSGAFQDITFNSGLQNIPGVVDASWMDYDRDGFVDLFVSNYAAQTLIFRNRGNGTFEDVTAGSGLETDSSSNVGLSWSDYDNDGDIDL